MMFKKVIVGSALLAAATLADFAVPVQNSDLEQRITLEDVSIPYPYQGHAIKRFTNAEAIANTYYTDGYPTILIPAAPSAEIGFSVLGAISLIASFALAIAKKFITKLITSIPALLVGITTVLGICKLTPVCDKLSHFRSLSDVQQEVISIATPERIARATEFVNKAIQKYEKLQDDEE